jgi:hypothetical protein
MTPPGLYRLVRDALTARYMTGSGCVLSNWACGQLAEIGVPALPAIEAVIDTDVLPAYTLSSESLDRRFPGLLSLLVTYFVIGKDAGDRRVVSFFGRLCGSVRVEAMRAVNFVWLLRIPTAHIPEAIMETVWELAEVGFGEVRELAQWLVGRAAE